MMIICSDGYNKESITQRFQVSTQFDSFTGIKTKYMVSWTTGSAWASLRFSFRTMAHVFLMSSHCVLLES